MNMKLVALIALGFLFVSNAYAKDGAASYALKKQGKIASASKETKGIEASMSAGGDQAGVPNIEPAAGGETPDQKTVSPANGDGGNLKEKLKLPRKY